MKKVFTLLSLFVALAAGKAGAQITFSVDNPDTTILSASGSYTATNNVNNTSPTDNITIQWRVSATNWPADWLTTLGICDMNGCYSDVWPSTLKECVYAPGHGDFHVQSDLTSVSTPGPYYLRVKLNRKDGAAGDTVMETYIISKSSVSASNVVKSSSNIVLYPNPATNSVNLVYEASSDIKNIALYNIIGRQINLFRPTDNSSANLNIDGIPAGIYFVRLINSRGDVVATRKFTKQ